MRRHANNFVDFQQRAREFSVGDIVHPSGMLTSLAGRVTAVWPAIGMADVEFSTGKRRFPVEDLLRVAPDNAASIPAMTTTGVEDMVSVSAGPSKFGSDPDQTSKSVSRVVKAFEKKALYWATRDRQYRMNRRERDIGQACCPRCEEHPPLMKAIYKRRGGASERLLGCPVCMFLIKESDIINSPQGELRMEVGS